MLAPISSAAQQWIETTRSYDEGENHWTRGQQPMAGEPDVALLMTASGLLEIFSTRLLRMKLFLYFSYNAISSTMQH